MGEFALTPHDATELAAAFLQAGITAGVALVCGYVYVRYRRAYFGVWALAWTLYAIRLVSIILFLTSERWAWLFVHQVLTGWTAVAFLWAAVAFSRPLPWRNAYLALVGFPVVWSYVAIYRLDEFLLAAAPAVAFLSIASAWTALVFWRHHRRVGSRAAGMIAVGFALWSLHHLDYPFLRARGAWNPWGYYIDILFSLAIGAGILLLVLEDQHRGLSVLSRLSADLQGRRRRDELLDALLARPLTLPGVVGSAMYDFAGGAFTEALGACADWIGGPGSGPTQDALRRMESSRGPESADDADSRFILAVPVLHAERLVAALVVLARARHPFAALDERFLVALGHQVGAAIANAELQSGLERRGAELERLASRMVRQHEEERERLYRDLHDESAQVFAALKLQLGMLREGGESDRTELLSRAEELVRTGIRSIRSAVRDLRPALLDDIGLGPALRGLADDFAERSGLAVHLELDATPVLSDEAELILYRSLQEGLSNVARHARGVTEVDVAIRTAADAIVLEVADDGDPAGDAEPGSGSGLVGMRERLAPLGGSVQLRREATGARLVVHLPLDGGAA